LVFSKQKAPEKGLFVIDNFSVLTEWIFLRDAKQIRFIMHIIH